LSTVDEKSFDVKDARFETIVACDVGPERLGTGFGFTEGPVWDARNRRLIFSDMKQDCMRSWSAEQAIATFRQPSNKANGNAFDHMGRLLSCEHVTSRVVRQTTQGTLEIIASHFEGKQLNSPNDIIVKQDGAIYFTDPTYGRIREDLGLLREPELAFRGVYRVSPDDGELRLLANDFEQPNGLCFSADDRTLFVNDTMRKHIRRFDVLPDGSVSGGDVWAETVGDAPGAPDGMKIDVEDHLFCTGPGGIHVFDTAARLLGVILLPERVANFNWGGDDKCTLFVTASTSLYRLKTRLPGRV
jgi:gluconolactonase